MKSILVLLIACAGLVLAQNPSPCLNIVNTAGAGQVLSAVNGGTTTPPCKWITGGGGGGSGTVTSIATTLPIQGGTIHTTGTISCRTATTAVSGCLSAADWNTFNNKGAGTVTSLTATSPIVVTPTPTTTTGVISCPTCTPTAFIDHQDPTGDISMTGSDVVIYSTSIPGGTMGAGKCLSATIWHLTNAAGTATDYKLTYGATSYTLLAANAGVGVSTYWFLRLCNNVGVTNAQTLYDPYIAYNVGPLGVFVSASGMAPVTGTFAVDSTATQTLAFKANSAGSTVKGYEWRVTVDR